FLCCLEASRGLPRRLAGISAQKNKELVDLTKVCVEPSQRARRRGTGSLYFGSSNRYAQLIPSHLVEPVVLPPPQAQVRDRKHHPRKPLVVPVVRRRFRAPMPSHRRPQV